MNEIYEFLKDCGTYFLATVEDNKPKIRPFGTVDLYNGHLTIQTGLKKDVAKQMLKNPNIAISAFKDGKWLRIDAKVSLDDSKEASEHMLTNYPHLRGMYTPGDGNCCVFVLDSGVASINSFVEAPKIIKF